MTPDDGLRQQALARLGPLAPPLARAALEAGVVDVERNVLEWQGSMGTVHAHRVVLSLEPLLCEQVQAIHPVVDALTAALAAAVARVAGNALAELRIEPSTNLPRLSPYRGRL